MPKHIVGHGDIKLPIPFGPGDIIKGLTTKQAVLCIHCKGKNKIKINKGEKKRFFCVHCHRDFDVTAN